MEKDDVAIGNEESPRRPRRLTGKALDMPPEDEVVMVDSADQEPQTASLGSAHPESVCPVTGSSDSHWIHASLPECKVLGYADTELSRRCGYARQINQARPLMQALGFGHLILADMYVRHVDRLPLNTIRTPDSNQGVVIPYTGDSLGDVVTQTMEEISPPDGASVEANPYDISSLLKRYNINCVAPGHEKPEEPEPVVMELCSPDTSEVPARRSSRRQAASLLQHPARGEDEVLFQYVNASISTSGSTVPFTVKEKNILQSWCTGKGVGPDGDGETSWWWTQELLDFATAIFLGDGQKHGLGVKTVVLPSTYYDLYISRAAMYSQTNSTEIKKGAKIPKEPSGRNARIKKSPKSRKESPGRCISAHASKTAFANLGDTTGGAMEGNPERSIWRTNAILSHVHVNGNHWVLVIITNLDALHDDLEGVERSMKDMMSIVPRVLVLDSMKTGRQNNVETIAERVRNWLANMYFADGPYVMTPVPGGCVKRRERETKSLTPAQVYTRIKLKVHGVLVETPFQKDSRSCGPYAALAMFKCVENIVDLRSIASLVPIRSSVLTSAYSQVEVKRLCEMLLQSVDVIVAKRIVHKDTTGTWTSRFDSPAAEFGRLYKCPFTKQ